MTASSTDSGEAGLREALEPFAAIAERYLTGGLRSDLEQRAPDLIGRLKAEDFYRAHQALAAHQAGEKVSDPSRGDDGWIAWSGGDNPVPRAMVFARWVGGEDIRAWPSESIAWGIGRDDKPYVIAYRLAPNTTGKAPEAAGEGGHE